MCKHIARYYQIVQVIRFVKHFVDLVTPECSPFDAISLHIFDLIYV